MVLLIGMYHEKWKYMFTQRMCCCILSSILSNDWQFETTQMSLTFKWIRKCGHMIDYFSAIQRNQMLCTITWVNPISINPNEKKLDRKYYIFYDSNYRKWSTEEICSVGNEISDYLLLRGRRGRMTVKWFKNYFFVKFAQHQRIPKNHLILPWKCFP